MPEEKKRIGRPKGSKNKVQKPRGHYLSMYVSQSCYEAFQRALERGEHGTTKGAVLCAALAALERSTP